jgi:hypothetical protein
VGECQILPVAKLLDLAQRLHIQMGIIAVPADAAQAVKLPLAMVTMMQWPQLATALAGGLIALGLTHGFERLVGRTER